MATAQRGRRGHWTPRRTPTGPDATLEAQCRTMGFRTVCGVDEAGRGPLAGPVVAAAVVLPFGDDGSGNLTLPPRYDALNDSKQLAESTRDALFERLCEEAVVSIASVSARTIDDRNIRKASLDAMRRAVLGLQAWASFALIDGTDVPEGLPCAGNAIVKGDGRSVSIAAASICAKVARDRMMVAADRAYQGYGFAAHKGYATPTHKAALDALGPSPIHRLTFAPVRAAAMRSSGTATN